jgi:hypothetical protein
MLSEKGTEIENNFNTIGGLGDTPLKKFNRKSMDDLPLVTNNTKSRLRTMSNSHIKTAQPKRFSLVSSVERIQTINKFNSNEKCYVEFDSPQKLKVISKKYKNLNSDNLKRLVGDFEELTGNFKIEPYSCISYKNTPEGKSSCQSNQPEFNGRNSICISNNESPIKKTLSFFPKVSILSTLSSQNKKSVLGLEKVITPAPKISGFRISSKNYTNNDKIWNEILNENNIKKSIEPRKKSNEEEDMLPKKRMLELKRTILKEKDKMKEVIDSLKRQQIMSKDKLKTFISNLNMQKIKGLK